MAGSNIGYLLAGTAGVLWSTMGVLGKIAFRYGIDPLSLVTLRAIIASLTLALIVAMVNRDIFKIRARDALFFALFGLIGVAANYSSYFYAIKLTTVSTAVILLYTYPAFVTIFSRHLFGERIGIIKLFALILTFTGCALVVRLYSVEYLKLNYLGIVFGLIAGLTAAVYSILSKLALREHNSSTIVLYAFSFGALFLLIFSLLARQSQPATASMLNFPPQVWLITLVIAWFPTLSGYFAYTSSLRYIEASRASIVSTIEPVSASLLAHIFLGETISGLQALGIALVLTGIMMIRLYKGS